MPHNRDRSYLYPGIVLGGGGRKKKSVSLSYPKGKKKKKAKMSNSLQLSKMLKAQKIVWVEVFSTSVVTPQWLCLYHSECTGSGASLHLKLCILPPAAHLAAFIHSACCTLDLIQAWCPMPFQGLTLWLCISSQWAPARSQGQRGRHGKKTPEEAKTSLCEHAWCQMRGI